MANETSKNEFSVYQFFKSGDVECVRRFVSAYEAMQAFKHYTQSVAARIGLVERVIVTDSGDYTNLEWVHKKGITFPTPTDLIEEVEK